MPDCLPWGTGTELEMAKSRNIPILMIAEDGRKIERSVEGAATIFIRFKELRELGVKLIDSLKKLV